MSEQDRELLDLAAKAAGIAGEWDVFMGTFRHYLDDERRFLGKAWAPLTDDGDALRLAVKLQLSVLFYPGSHVDVVAQNILEDGDLCAAEGYDTDPLAATRRCITRAAALAKGEGKV